MTNIDKNNRTLSLKLATILVFASALTACTTPPAVEQPRLSYEVPIDDCPTLDACLAKMYEVARPPESKYAKISAEELPVAERIAQFGDPAVAKVVPLLRSANEDIAQIAALILREVEHIDEKYLPDIVEALDSDYDLGWLPPALGRINSDAAAAEAVKRYVSRSAPHNQEASAVKLSGLRAIPHIVKAAMCGTECDSRRHYILASVLRDMDEKVRISAAKQLMQGTQPGTSEEDIEGLLYLVSSLGSAGLVVEQDLLALKNSNASLEPAVNDALIGIGSKHAGIVFAAALHESPSYYVLRDLSELGPRGIDAGPVTLELVNSPEWDIRAAAASALGHMEYQEAVPSLTLLLDEPDILLNWIAVESLGRIADPTSREALTRVMKQHWHPAVRSAAEKALTNLTTGNEYIQPSKESDYLHIEIEGYFGYSQLDTPPCESVNLEQVPEPLDTKLYTAHAEERLKKLAFDTEIIGYSAADEEEQLAENPDGVVIVNAENIFVHHDPIKQVPNLALRVNNGWLVGSHRGEWGGELAFIRDDGELTILLEENIEDIYQLGNRYIAVTGLAHLTLNRGAIFEITPHSNGNWVISLWRKLPGAPLSSWLVDTGELLINTRQGGSILVTEGGTMRMAPCHQE